MTQGFTAEKYLGLSVALERHSDGSVTICKELIDDIIETLESHTDEDLVTLAKLLRVEA